MLIATAVCWLWTAALVQGPAAPDAERGARHYRVFGDTVVGTTLTAVRLPGADATSEPTRICTRNVYARIDGRWRWASSQSTTVQAAPTGTVVR